MKNTFILLGLLLTFFVQAQNTEMLDSANSRYSYGKYEQAIVDYKSIIKSGYISPELYFNLGNSFYRTGDFPRAILSYERARVLSPNDEDIQFNLHMAFLQVSAKNESKPELTVNKWSKNLRLKASSDTWAIFSIIGFIALLASVLVFLFTGNMLIKKSMLGAAILALLFTSVSIIFSHQRKNDILIFNTAVISEPTVTVKSSPDVNGNDVFIVYEGALVTVKDSIIGWKNVALQNGEVGWIPEESVVSLQ